GGPSQEHHQFPGASPPARTGPAEGPAARTAPDPPAADCLWPPTQWDDLSSPPAGESRRRATAPLVGAPRTHSWPWSRSAAGDGTTRPRSSPSLGPGLHGRPASGQARAAGRVRLLDESGISRPHLLHGSTRRPLSGIVF